MDKRNRISVVINTYNAEQHLAAVLESVKDFDEVLICDMESTDTTLDIARQYGCRIITFERKVASSPSSASSTTSWNLPVNTPSTKQSTNGFWWSMPMSWLRPS